MNFITFPVAATNLFPAANSRASGQLLTEWNLRSRETVTTDPNVTYQVGPSYVHGEPDFEVGILMDSGGSFVNTYTLSIAEGRGVINGHYVETLVPMTVDLVEANAQLQAQMRPILKGDLAIGIRTFYATEETVAGSILVENEDDMYLGVQLVVLPEEEMITPSDSPSDSSKVTADLKLATFTFLNNTISGLKNLKSKLQYLSSERIADLDAIASSKYVTKTGLNSKKIYAFAGKGATPGTGYDTWEDVTDSLIVWDAEPKRTATQPGYPEAQFATIADNIYMIMPHKQVTGMTDDDGNPEYYMPKTMKVPLADYSTNTAGVVNKEYTRRIKSIGEQVSDFRSTLTGKQIMFKGTLATVDDLPQINDAWEIGDYVLVKNDVAYYDGDESESESAPATKYVVLPGQVDEIQFITEVDGSAIDEATIPENITGVELVFMEWYQSAGQDLPETAIPSEYPDFFADDDVVRGIPGDIETDQWVDYFRIRYFYAEPDDEEGSEEPFVYPYTDFYYGVLHTKPREWSEAVLITGGVPYATEEVLGGFLNVSTDATDNGYVFLDDTGHLKLLDYELLRSGTLAYQIGEDMSIPNNSDPATVQTYLNEYVNQRVAFPSSSYTGNTSPIIHIYIPFPAEDEDENTSPVYEINGIDSRFNTAVCLHILGEATSKTTINIRDCQKIKIDNDIEGSPVINIFRSCLYYDPVVFQYIRTCTRDADIYGAYTGFLDLSIWYEKLNAEDAPLLVDGMTVSELDAQIITTEIDYWKELGTAANDNNYLVALKSITFSGAGDIVGCEVLTANNSTDNVDQGDKIVVGNFNLPQGSSLIYPQACLTRVLKVTGEFTSAYLSDDYWYVTDTSFTLQTGTYDPYSLVTTIPGTIAFHSKTALVPNVLEQTSIEVWEPDTYHVFSGGAIS